MNSKTLKLLALLLATGISAGAGAQSLSDYDFVYDIDNFQTIVDAPGVHTEAWGYSQQDDGYRNFSMPFAFPFGDDTIAQGSNVILSANGYVQFATFSLGSSVGTLYSVASHPYRAIAPFINSDGYCRGNIYWLDTVDASDGLRLLICEFRGITTYSARTSPESVNYQVRISEDGTVVIHYDSSDFNAIANHTLIMANTGADRLCLTGSWAQPVVATPATASASGSLDGVPAPGTRYTFSRPGSFCVPPANLSADQLSHSGMHLSWQGSAQGYTVYYSDNDTAWSDSVDVVTPEYDLSSLQSHTLYRIAVRAICADGLVSDLSQSVSLRTLYNPDCMPPQAIAIDTASFDYAELSIADSTASDAAVYDVAYWSASGDTAHLEVVGTAVTLSGLRAGTTYFVSASKVCADEPQTEPVQTSFTTACTSLSFDDLPYRDDFNSYEPYIGAPINPCWTIVNLNDANNYPYPSAYQNHSGLNGNSLYFYANHQLEGQYVSLPAIDDLSGLTLSFWTLAPNTTPRLDVGVMSDPLDTATFLTVYTVEPLASGVWEEHLVHFDSPAVAAMQQSGSLHVALRNRHVSPYATGYGISVDDLVLDAAPVCPRPLALSLSDATESSLSLSIDDTASIGHYRLWVYTADTLVDSLDINSASYTLYDLAPGTLYTVSAASLCYGNPTERVSASAATLCAVIAEAELPWSEDFEGWPVGIHAPLNPCWQAFYSTSDTILSSYAKVYAATDLDAGHTAVKMLAQHSYSTGEQYSTLVLPLVDVNPRRLQLDLRLRFAYQQTDPGEYVEVGVLSDPADPHSFVPCSLIENPGNYLYHDYSVRFGRYPYPTSGALAVRYHYNVPNDNSHIFVDSVALSLLDEEDVACEISALHVSDITDSSAVVAWNYNCEASGFEVELLGGDEDRNLLTSDTSVALTALQPATAYTVRVRVAGDFWSQPVYFYTTVSPTPSDTSASDTTHVDPVDPVNPSDSSDHSAVSVVALQSVALCPNPVASGYTVTLRGVPAAAAVSVCDATGRPVLSNLRGDSFAIKQPGVYFVVVSSGSSRTVRKLVVL